MLDTFYTRVYNVYTMTFNHKGDTTMTLDDRINNLKPGQSIEVSNNNGIRVTAERSGNGELIRFVRFNPNQWCEDGAWQVIRTRNFSDRS